MEIRRAVGPGRVRSRIGWCWVLLYNSNTARGRRSQGPWPAKLAYLISGYLYPTSGQTPSGPLGPLLGLSWASWALSKNCPNPLVFDTLGFLGVRKVMDNYLGTLLGPLGPSWALLGFS